MTILNRMLKLRHITLSTKAGDDPDAIDDVTESIGDWPEISEPCPSNKAPAGQCDYTKADRFTRCIYCGRPSGLDQ